MIQNYVGLNCYVASNVQFGSFIYIRRCMMVVSVHIHVYAAYESHTCIAAVAQARSPAAWV